MTEHFLILLLALLLDRIVGDPPALWRHVPHPVVLFGKAIAFADTRLNRRALPPAQRRRNGVIAIAVLLFLSVAFGCGLHLLLAVLGPLGILIEVAIAAVFFAQKSLSDHVLAVAEGLKREGLSGGRRAVSMIVGRDPETLDEAGISRAALESLAENFSDGVVAPAFWYAALGLPGLLAYKMLNTADSMIGHLSEKYADFGWAAARLDDLANWPAARLSMLLIAAGAWVHRGSAAARAAIDLGLRDHGLHRSPNSGWPEAAMAGALDLALAGPRVYGGVQVREPMMNAAGRQDASVFDIEAGVAVFKHACSALAAIALVAFVILLVV